MRTKVFLFGETRDACWWNCFYHQGDMTDGRRTQEIDSVYPLRIKDEMMDSLRAYCEPLQLPVSGFIRIATAERLARTAKPQIEEGSTGAAHKRAGACPGCNRGRQRQISV